ncbi:DUF1758 domain-containing protein [Nephila pilipes]|uniref:DUF1758 domain-containing protein n=1 Tax=Nephila pilipes TaxID=299642 RepID=A0A8X6N0J3_NEPPI|nr:DUF1758 domain-containing protein [Nephila pilipes]
MMRFRKHPFAYIADIQKMYGMINIHPSHRILQRIEWKDSELSPVKTFELSTVTYSTVSAPFLATQTLLQFADDEGNNFLFATSIVKEDFYVDDVLSDAKILPEWIEMQQQLTSMLNRTSMKLHKWRDVEVIKLHSFYNASEASFGAVVYRKSQTPARDVAINIVASKSRRAH